MKLVHFLAVEVRFLSDLAANIVKDGQRVICQRISGRDRFSHKPKPYRRIKLAFNRVFACENYVNALFWRKAIVWGVHSVLMLSAPLSGPGGHIFRILNRDLHDFVYFAQSPRDSIGLKFFFSKNDLRKLEHVQDVYIKWEHFTGTGIFSRLVYSFPVFNSCSHNKLADMSALIASLGPRDDAYRGNGTGQAGDASSKNESGSGVELHTLLIICGGIVAGNLIGLILAGAIMKCLRWI